MLGEAIRATVVRDLEADRIESSGGAIYARGHVKSICGSVGVPAAPYLDLFSRQVVGWSLREDMTRDIVIDALRMACATLSLDLPDPAAVQQAATLLTEAAQLAPDLIIAQLSEPTVDGFALCRKLRAEADTRHTPVLVLTRFDDPYTREQIVRAGATAIASPKPHGKSCCWI